MHGLKVGLFPVFQVLSHVIASQKVISVVIFQKAAASLAPKDRVENDSFPKVKNQNSRVNSFEHQGHSDQKDNQDHDDSEIVTDLLDQAHVGASLFPLVKDDQSVAGHVKLGEEVEEPEEVDERSRSRVHENQGKHDHVHGVHIAIPEGVVSAVLAKVTHSLVLLVSKAALENLRKQVSHLEKSSEDRKCQLIEDIAIVEKPVWMFIDESEELDESPAGSQDIHQVESVAHKRASDDIKSEKDDQDFHLLHLDLILEMRVLPLRRL